MTNKEMIKTLNRAKDAYIKGDSPLVPINLVLMELMNLESIENYQANEMGKDYWKQFEDNTGTLRSTINDLDKLTGGELKSTWSKDV